MTMNFTIFSLTYFITINTFNYIFSVLTGMIEMGNICSVPLSFIIMRGQGIKLLSFLSKECRKKNVLMPDLDKTKGNEGFEGAIVLPPKCDLYLDEPVPVVDYSSLYPSSIISENLSHDSKVWTKEYDLKGRIKRVTGTHEYDNLPGFKFVDKKIDTFRYKKVDTFSYNIYLNNEADIKYIDIYSAKKNIII